VTLTREELESKSKGSQLTSEDLDQIMKNQDDAEKYQQLKEKMKEIDEESTFIDRLDACDFSGAAEVLRTFLSSK
jgi:hypothetical protein